MWCSNCGHDLLSEFRVSLEREEVCLKGCVGRECCCLVYGLGVGGAVGAGVFGEVRQKVEV